MKKILAAAVLLGMVAFAASAAVAGDHVSGYPTGTAVASPLGTSLVPASMEDDPGTYYVRPAVHDHDHDTAAAGQQ